MDIIEDDLNAIDLLPDLVQDLYTWQSPVQEIIHFVESMAVLLEASSPSVLADLDRIKNTLRQIIDRYQKEGGETTGGNAFDDTDIYGYSELLQELEPHLSNKTALTIDANNSILLSLIFGNMYTKAMIILSEARNIQIYANVSELVDQHRIINEYFNCGSNKVRIRIRDVKTAVNDSSFTKLALKYAQLKTESLLNALNLSFTAGQLTKQASSRSKSIQESTDKILLKLNTIDSTRNCYVDIFNWYCTCDEYYKCYSEDWLGGSHPTFYSFKNSHEHKLFKNIRFDKIDPLPLCTHLLVVLIIKLNFDHTYLNGVNQLFQINQINHVAK